MVEPSETEARERWRRILIEGHRPLLIANAIFRYLPGPPRCKGCHNSFGGIGGAEPHRIQGYLLWDGGNVKEAHASYLRALEAALEIKALMVELRAAIRICLLLSKEKLREPRGALKELYSRFTEGFETPDLKEAHRLLERLPDRPERPRTHRQNAP